MSRTARPEEEADEGDGNHEDEDESDGKDEHDGDLIPGTSEGPPLVVRPGR